MSFGFNPAGNGFPSQAPEGFPNYIQFQADGVDLGLPDVDTVDFVYPLVATRGAGENANVVTVTSASNPSTPAAGSTPVMAFTLAGSGSGSGVSSWTYTSLVADASVGSFNDTSDEITFADAGVYEVRVASRLTLNIGNVATYATLRSGSGTGPDQMTTGSRHNVAGDQEQYDFTDSFLLSMSGGDLVRNFVLELDNTEQSVTATLSVVITKLA